MRVRPVPSRGARLPSYALTLSALGLLWAGGALLVPARPAAVAAPVAQDAPEPTPLWPERTLYGGPIHDLAVAPDTDPEAEDSQRIWAAGNGLFHATRGLSWTRAARDLPEAVGVIAASADTVFVTDSEGEGHRTVNGGRGWTSMRLAVEGAFRFVATSPDFESEEQVYAIGLENGRLWRSSNGGARWSEVIVERGAQLQAGAVGFSPLFGGDETVFLGTERGLHESQDGGLSWSEARGGGPTFGPAVGSLAHQGIWVNPEFGDDPKRKIDPIETDIFAWNPTGLWLTSDRGQTWRTVALPTSIERLHDVAITPGWPVDRVIAIAGAGAGEAGPLGAVSEDGGQSWREIPSSPGLVGTSITMAQDFWHFRGPDVKPPRRSPQLTEFIFLPGVYRGFDFGEDFEPPSPIVLRREIYLGTDGAGLWISEDLGRSWSASQESLRNVQPTALTYLDDRSLLAGSVASGLFRSEDDGDGWQRVDSPLARGATGTIHALATSPDFARDRTVLAATDGGLWSSRDAGVTWSRGSGPAGARALAFSPDFATDRTLLADTMRSTDAGASWSPVTGLDDVAVRALAFSPRFAQDQTVWAGGERADDPTEGVGLRVSTDGGASFEPLAVNVLRDRILLSLIGLAVDPSEEVRWTIGTDRGMVRSTDGGESFERVRGVSSSDTGGLVGAVVDEPFRTGLLFAASRDGAYWSQNRGIDFEREPRSPPAASGHRPHRRTCGASSRSTPTGLTFADVAVLLEAGD